MGTKNNYTDLSGRKFGRLLVLSRAADRISKSGKARIYYMCICDCGNKKEIIRNSLAQGTTLSCGCLRKELTELKKVNANPNRMVAGKITTEYKIWSGIKQRCHNPNDTGYPKYGKRGIKMCDRWLESFNNFLEDMGKRPSLKHSLDRYPNRDGNYEKDNCRWATDMEQACNRRGITWIDYKGMRKVKEHWALYFGVTQTAFDFHYIKKKRSMEEIEAYYNKKKQNK